MQLMLTGRSGSSSSKNESGPKTSFAFVTPRHSLHTGHRNNPCGTGSNGVSEAGALTFRVRFDFESESMKPSTREGRRESA